MILQFLLQTLHLMGQQAVIFHQFTIVFQNTAGLTVSEKDTDSGSYQKRHKHGIYHNGVSRHKGSDSMIRAIA